jgi:hypothetical protein
MKDLFTAGQTILSAGIIGDIPSYVVLAAGPYPSGPSATASRSPPTAALDGTVAQPLTDGVDGSVQVGSALLFSVVE